MIYLAYGLNMDIPSMYSRCPGSEYLGMGKIPNMKLTFRTFATIEPDPNNFVPVMIWEINRAAEKSLDITESFPTYYRKETIKFEWAEGNEDNSLPNEGMVYIMNHINKNGVEIHPILPSTTWYFNLIKNTYINHNFDTTYIDSAYQDAYNNWYLNHTKEIYYSNPYI